MPGLAQQSCPDLCASATVCLRAPGSEEGQPELAHLDLVPVVQGSLLDPLAVHVGAVQAAYVAHDEPGSTPVELRVAPGYCDVVEEDVAARMAAHRGEVAVEQEPAARIRAAFHQQQSGTGRQGLGRRRLR